MLLGDFESAWRESDSIALRGAAGPLALWDRRSFEGKRVVIRCLHGYGDAIQFLRYAPMVRRFAATVIAETHPEMVSLVARMKGIDQVSSWAPHIACEPLARDAWDQQIEVTELPMAFRTTVNSIPAEIPYIDIDAAARLRSFSLLGNTSKPKVGILWASSTWNPARSLPVTELLPALNFERFSFCSFQRGPERSDLSGLQIPLFIHDTAQHSPEIADTAADLLNMDLLITVDTMAAHLAGALGTETWLMLPFEADWRWMLDRDDTPWYPGTRLFRQPRPGDWWSVVDRIADALNSWLPAKRVAAV